MPWPSSAMSKTTEKSLPIELQTLMMSDKLRTNIFLRKESNALNECFERITRRSRRLLSHAVFPAKPT